MFKKVASHIADQLEENGIVKSEDKSLYSYGLQQGFTMLLNFSTTLILGFVFGKVVQSILFTALYMPIRRFAGGFHAKTPVQCYIYSTVMTAVVLWLTQLLDRYVCILIFLSAFGAITIALLSPVEDIHKPLEWVEQCVYRRKSLLILMLEIVIVIISLLLKLHSILSVTALTLFSTGILVVLGKIKNRFITNQGILNEKAKNNI